MKSGHKNESQSTHHNWPKVHTPPHILILVEHTGLMLPASWPQLPLEHMEHMVLHDRSWTQTISLPAAAPHPQSHHSEISPRSLNISLKIK